MTWHLVDSVLAVATGAIAAWPAVVVFGVRSLAVLLGALVVLWRLSPARLRQPEAEETAEPAGGPELLPGAGWPPPALTVAAMSPSA